MKSRKTQSHSRSGRLAGPVADPAWDAAVDMSRQQAAVASEGASVMLRGLQAMRKIQDEAVRQASSRYAAAAEKMNKHCEPADLVELQAELARFDLESAFNYWQQMAAATFEMQTEMMNCASHLLDSDAVLESASVLNSLRFAVPGFDRSFTRTAPVH